MKPISILFYVEPVCFRRDPLMLSPCVDWIRLIMQNQPASAGISFAFASSPFLCRVLAEQTKEKPCPLFIVDPRAILAPFDFDRHAYGRDLYADSVSDEVNTPLAQFLRELGQDYAPDVVITFSQNRYIESIFADRHTLFVEMGPLPRHGGAHCFFFDPRGHQVRNLLNSKANIIRTLSVSNKQKEAALAEWDRLITVPTKIHPLAEEIVRWMKQKRQRRNVILLAMQSPDWLTYEAAYDALPPDGLMMRWLSALSPDWMAIATHHAHFQPGGNAAIDSMMTELFPAFEVLPPALTKNPIFQISEILMPHIDAVATISSAVGMTALLSGKKVVAYGRSYLNGFCGSDLQNLSATPTLTEHERASLLIFLTNFYCHSWEDILMTPGYFAQTIHRIVESVDPLNPYFDLNDWSPDKLEKLLIG